MSGLYRAHATLAGLAAGAILASPAASAQAQGTGETSDARIELECASDQGRYTRCVTDAVTILREARLVRQRSRDACVEGSTWGYDRVGVWTDRGCAGRFVLTGFDDTLTPETVECNSGRYGRNFCPIPSGREVYAVRIERQRSSAACVAGENWGWDRTGVWVDAGCRARFVLNDPNDVGRNEDAYTQPDEPGQPRIPDGPGPSAGSGGWGQDDPYGGTGNPGSTGGYGGYGGRPQRDVPITGEPLPDLGLPGAYEADPYQVAREMWRERGFSEAEVAIAACSRRLMRAAWEDADYAAMFEAAPRAERLSQGLRGDLRDTGPGTAEVWRVDGVARVHNPRGFQRFEIQCRIEDGDAVEFAARELR